MFEIVKPTIVVRSRRDPHAAIKYYMNYFLRRASIREPTGDVLRRNLNSFYRTDGPGKGFGEGLPNVYGYYDDEDMSDLDIEPFEGLSTYVVLYRDYVDYDIVMYSRAEFEGWMTMCFRELYVKHPKNVELFELIESEYYERDGVFSELLEKLNGKIPWAHGPMGAPISAEQVQQWHAFHKSGFADTYTEYLKG